MKHEAADVLAGMAPTPWIPPMGPLLVLQQGTVMTAMTEAERIARALQTIKLQLGTGQWSLHEIRHILEGKEL